MIDALANGETEDDDRQRVIDELNVAFKRLALDMPHLDAALLLRLIIGYFAGVYASAFGHAATVQALIKIARRGIWLANEELTATRN